MRFWVRLLVVTLLGCWVSVVLAWAGLGVWWALLVASAVQVAAMVSWEVK